MSRDDPRTEAIHEAMVALFGDGDEAERQIRSRILGSLYDEAHQGGIMAAASFLRGETAQVKRAAR